MSNHQPTTIKQLDRALALALADCEADYPGATDDPGVVWDLVRAVALDADWHLAAEFCRRHGATPPPPPRQPTAAERKAAALARRDAVLADPANAEALARIRARRDRVRGLARGRV